jgi:hypothetical protein
VSELVLGFEIAKSDGKMWRTVWHTKRCRTSS